MKVKIYVGNCVYNELGLIAQILIIAGKNLFFNDSGEQDGWITGDLDSGTDADIVAITNEGYQIKKVEMA